MLRESGVAPENRTRELAGLLDAWESKLRLVEIRHGAWTPPSVSEPL